MSIVVDDIDDVSRIDAIEAEVAEKISIVALSNVDNTSDADKPISTLQAIEFSTKEPKDSTILKTGDIGTSVLSPTGNGGGLTGIVGSSTQAFATSDLSVTGTIVATGDITAFSDKRLKDNIEVIPDALHKVCKLNGVTFTRTDLQNDIRYTGLIAQDVQKVLPEAITINGDYLSVAYGNIVGLLVEAIKELQQEIKEIKG